MVGGPVVVVGRCHNASQTFLLVGFARRGNSSRGRIPSPSAKHAFCAASPLHLKRRFGSTCTLVGWPAALEFRRILPRRPDETMQQNRGPLWVSALSCISHKVLLAGTKHVGWFADQFRY